MKGWPWGNIDRYMKQKECNVPVFSSLQMKKTERGDIKGRNVCVYFSFPEGGGVCVVFLPAQRVAQFSPFFLLL